MKTKKISSAEFIQWMNPLLDALRELGGSGKAREVSDLIADNLHLTEEKRLEKLKSGTLRFHNQVMWAKQYLGWEGLVTSSKRGVWSLTEQGRSKNLSLEESSDIMNRWVEFHHKEKEKTPKENSEEVQEFVEPRAEETLLDVLKRVSPAGFEQICMLLLREAGFEKLKVTGKSHDEGIDGVGILQLNPFVSFKVLFQCKRYKGTVSRSQVGDFRNAMMGRAEKGIMLTTGSFSADAEREANREGVIPVELVDGEKLVEMFEHLELGVRSKNVYEVDLDFFIPYM